MKGKAKRTAFIGVLASVALVLSYLEAILPPLYGAIPGIKVGLPNIVIIFMLYRFGLKEAAAVSAVRLVITALLFGNTMTFVYSLAGAAVSLAVMAVLKKADKFSVIGVSIAGGVAHNLGQICVAIVLLSTTQLGYYGIVLAFTGTLAGVAVGIAGNLLISKTEKLKI